MTDGERGPLDFDEGSDLEGSGAKGPDHVGSDPEVPSPAAPARASRWGWVVGVIFLAWLVYITVNTLSSDRPGSRGVPEDSPLPAFAVPLALSNLEGDANIASRPDQGQAGKRSACQVRGPRILNSCQLAERGPVVLAFYASRAGKACRRQLDVLESVRGRFPGVQVAAVAIRGNRSDLKELIRESGWRFHIGYDHDGQVANLYRVAGCPTVTFAYPGGIVMHTYVGLLDAGTLAGAMRRLVAGSERRGWTPPRS